MFKQSQDRFQLDGFDFALIKAFLDDIFLKNKNGDLIKDSAVGLIGNIIKHIDAGEYAQARAYYEEGRDRTKIRVTYTYVE